MKPFSKVLLSALLLATAVPASAATTAEETGFYVGFEGLIDQISWKNRSFESTYTSTTLGKTSSSTITMLATDFSEGLMGLGMKLGYRFSPYLAVETGFGETTDDQRIMDDDANRYRYRMTIRQWQLDGYAYWPLGSSGRFKPFVTLGAALASGDARVRTEIDGTDENEDSLVDVGYTKYFQKREFEWRAGLGIEVRISDSVNGRIFARYQPYSFDALKGGATLGFTLSAMAF
jgi:opacity protein-like surface antigen